MSIPHIVYMFWDGPESQVASLCKARTKALNPSWTFVEANVENCEEICGRSLPLNHARMLRVHVSDWFRFNALARTGGVWMDVSCVSFDPLEAWVNRTSSALQAFCIPRKRKKVMDNWALACPAGCPFMRLWACEFNTGLEKGLENYRKSLPAYAFPGKGAVAWNGPYFTAHQIALKIMHEHPEYEVILHSSIHGPLHFALYDLEHLYECIERMYRGVPLENRHGVPFYKLCGRFRRKMDKYLKDLQDKDRITRAHRFSATETVV